MPEGLGIYVYWHLVAATVRCITLDLPHILLRAFAPPPDLPRGAFFCERLCNFVELALRRGKRTVRDVAPRAFNPSEARSACPVPMPAGAGPFPCYAAIAAQRDRPAEGDPRPGRLNLSVSRLNLSVSIKPPAPSGRLGGRFVAEGG